MAASNISLFDHLPTRIGVGILESFLAECPQHNFQVRLWDGTTLGSQQPVFTLVLNHPGALSRILDAPTELSLGEAYVSGDVDVEGDLEAAFQLGDFLLGRANRSSGAKVVSILKKLPSRRPARPPETATLSGTVHSRQRDRQAISYHYDLPAEFYALWLDRRMLYSCAYFYRAADWDLDTAQGRKLDYICRKLRLRTGERLLDIGCGWGGLVIHAASHYGVEARGITLSVPQAELARQRIRDAGLDHCCRVDVCDYRDVELDQDFDKIVSVGMFEHVGEAHLPEYFSRVWELLRPGGAFLNHGISASATYERTGPSFVDKYVFPDGELVPANRSLAAAENAGLELRDVESLREHYVLTLRQWVRRLEANAQQAKRLTDETTYRIWRLYMAGSAHWFRTGRLNLYQILFAKPAHGNSGMPLTRADWYKD